jgi:uncharacterized membrane protein
MNKQHTLLTLATTAFLIVLVVLVLYMNASTFHTYKIYESGTISYENAKVTAVLEERLEPAEELPGWQVGNQKIIVKLESGPMKGQEITFDNNLSVTHNIHVKQGSSVIVKADRPEGASSFYSLYNYNRAPGLLSVALVFAVLLILVGRVKGLRSAAGLTIVLFFVIAFLIPAIYRGWSPVCAAVLTVLVVSLFSILLLNGFSSKSYTALAAVGIGMLMSALFYKMISFLLLVSGYNIGEAQTLILVSRATGLKIGEVLFASVLVASLGAVIDITVSVSSAMYEVKEKQTELSSRELFRSGMAVGRDIIGAQCMTLMLAFMGSALASLLILMTYGAQLNQILSSDYANIEVLHGITGSLAVITAVPVTAGLCAALSQKDLTKKGSKLKG